MDEVEMRGAFAAHETLSSLIANTKRITSPQERPRCTSTLRFPLARSPLRERRSFCTRPLLIAGRYKRRNLDACQDRTNRPCCSSDSARGRPSAGRC